MKVYIVTGERDAGKTSFLHELYDILSAKNLRVRGFLGKGYFTDNGDKDFVLYELGKGKTQHLASRNYHPEYFHPGNFYFNPGAIKSGKTIIEDALDEKADIIIMDEIGPLELMGHVWHDLLNNVLSKNQGTLIISVRKMLLYKIIEHFNIHHTGIFDIGTSNPPEIAEKLLSEN